MSEARSGRVLADAPVRIAKSVLRDQAPSEITAADAVRDALTQQHGSLPPAEDLMSLTPAQRVDLRDALSDRSCADAAKRINSCEATILQLKARYWAGQMRRKKLAVEHVKRISGEIITDPLLKARYFELLEGYASGNAAPLSPEETRWFIQLDRLAFELRQSCGL
jgi:hypothetical protein